jgi:predicted nucleotidyltransferase
MDEAAGHAIRFPTALHRAAVDSVLAGLRADPTVAGALVCGSLARGTARADSDVDVLVVLRDGAADDGAKRFSRTRHGAIEVEQSGRTSTGWLRQFAPSRVRDESWGYAFLDGAILYDPQGAVARLAAAATEVHAAYRVPQEITAHYAWLWGHLRPKMEAVLRAGDATEIGWTAAVMANHIVQTLWAASGRPLPSLDLGTFRRHLDDLTVPPDAPALAREMLQAPPQESLRLQLRILDAVVPRLQEGLAIGDAPP